jgi:hypothetical protein
VASITGVYPDRRKPCVVVWDKGELFPFDVASAIAAGQGLPVQQVHGNGFGCVMLRRSVLRECVLRHHPSPYYDVNFYYDVSDIARYKVLADFTLRCNHLEKPT